MEGIEQVWTSLPFVQKNYSPRTNYCNCESHEINFGAQNCVQDLKTMEKLVVWLTVVFYHCHTKNDATPPDTLDGFGKFRDQVVLLSTDRS